MNVLLQLMTPILVQDSQLIDKLGLSVEKQL